MEENLANDLLELALEEYDDKNFAMTRAYLEEAKYQAKHGHEEGFDQEMADELEKELKEAGFGSTKSALVICRTCFEAFYIGHIRQARTCVTCKMNEIT